MENSQTMRRTSILLAALLLLSMVALAGVPGARAEPESVAQTSVTHTVTEASDDGPGSLRHVVQSADSGDTIVFDITGTITLTTGAIQIERDLTIHGPGASQLHVSGNSQSQVFMIAPGISVTIAGLTIRDGNAPPDALGGGIYNGGTLTLSDCILEHNQALLGAGGGIAQTMGSTLTMSDCIVRENTSGGFAGGIYNGLESTLSISGSTITRNWASSDSGGGIFSIGTLSVVDSTISHNYAIWGGGIVTHGYTASIVDSEIRDNRALELAGGILNRRFLAISGSEIVGNATYILGPGVTTGDPAKGGGILNEHAAELEITNTTISQNDSAAGGGVYNAGILTTTESTVTRNQSHYGGGGGLYNATNGQLTVIDSSVTENIAGDWVGGAGFYNSGSASVIRSLIWANFASQSGGGVLNDFDAAMEISNSTISHNRAIQNGGGMLNWGDLSVVNATITDNRSEAWVGGGGIYSRPEGVTLAGSIVAGNPFGGNCALFATSIGYNLSDDETCGLDQPTDLTSSQNVNLDTLADNGGPTRTHALLDGSAAIDAIPLADCLVTHDQREIGRPQGGGCDIGAFELEVADDPLPTLTIIASSATMTYGDPVPAITPHFDGFVHGDDEHALDTPPTCETDATSSSDAGIYATTCSGAATDGYQIVYQPGELTITPREITVEADSHVKTAGDDDPELSWRVTSGELVNGDEISGALEREEGEDPGQYAIMQGALDAGTNYDLTFVAGTLTIVEPTPVDAYAVCLDFDNEKVNKLGSTVPIRLMLCDDDGTNLSSEDVVVSATRLMKVSNEASGEMNPDSSGNANPDGDFRFAGDRYVFNLSTKGLSQGTWRLEFSVDGQENDAYAVTFPVRR